VQFNQVEREVHQDGQGDDELEDPAPESNAGFGCTEAPLHESRLLHQVHPDLKQVVDPCEEEGGRLRNPKGENQSQLDYDFQVVLSGVQQFLAASEV